MVPHHKTRADAKPLNTMGSDEDVDALQNAINMALDIPGVVTKPGESATFRKSAAPPPKSRLNAAPISTSTSTAHAALTDADGGRSLKLVMQYLSEGGHVAALQALEEQVGSQYDSHGAELAGELMVIVSQHDMLNRLTEDDNPVGAQRRGTVHRPEC